MCLDAVKKSKRFSGFILQRIRAKMLNNVRYSFVHCDCIKRVREFMNGTQLSLNWIKAHYDYRRKTKVLKLICDVADCNEMIAARTAMWFNWITRNLIQQIFSRSKIENMNIGSFHLFLAFVIEHSWERRKKTSSKFKKFITSRGKKLFCA